MTLLSETSSAIQSAPGAIQGFLGLTTPNRLRRELRETMDLYERATKLSQEAKGGHPDVNEAAATLARLIKKEANDLNAAVGGPLRIFQPDWRTIGLVASVFLVLVLSEAILLGSGFRGHPLGWALIVVVGAAAVILGIVLVPTLVQAVRGPRRTIITGIRAEDLASLLGIEISRPGDGDSERGSALKPPDAQSRATT